MNADIIRTQLELSTVILAIGFEVERCQRITRAVPRYVLARICEASAVDQIPVTITDKLRERQRGGPGARAAGATRR